MKIPKLYVAEKLSELLGNRKVLSDAPALRAYAIDASIHKITPQAVVLIESSHDVEVTLSYARSHHIPVTARSGGTNLVGNAIGDGIILEFSRLNRILEFNPEERWIRIQPGMIYGELSRFLARHHLMFAPDPSSGEMCKLGGMIGTNAAGPHTLKYGATKDHIISMNLVLADGKPLLAKRFDLESDAFKALRKDHAWIDPLIYFIRSHTALLREKKPRVSKNSSGYNLFALAEALETGILDLPRLFVGSEGTLGLTLDATLRLLPRPARTVTALLYLERFEEVGHLVRELLSLSPGALELLDSNSLNLIGRSQFGIPETTRAVLLIELDEEPLEDRIRMLETLYEKYHVTQPLDVARDPEQQEALWQVRKSIYPTLYRYYDQRKKPINFADDVVVPVEKLPELVNYLDGLFKPIGIPVAIYGHVGDGNAHINPLLDLNAPEDFETMVRLSREIHQTVISEFGGSICGEHGDGRVRGEFVKALYGEEIYRLFQETKQLFDPEGILNPGVKITDTPFTEHIDFERLSKPCATCGRCNTVCPVYDVRLDESNGARGWFHILTDPDYSTADATRVVDACLNCKSCRVVCPAGIDVSSLILEKRAEHPNRIAGLIFQWQARPKYFEPFIKFAGRTQSLWDRPWPRKLLEILARPALKALAPAASFPHQMMLPKLVSKTLRERYREFTEEAGAGGSIAYFHGCAANYFMDGVGDAIIRILKKRNISFVLPRQRCSGTPVETYGHRDLTREHAEYNLSSLLRYEKIVTSCASCTFMLKDYTKFFEGEQQDKAKKLSERVTHISQFLLNELPFETPDSDHPTVKVAYHSSCHLRAAGVSREPKDLLRRLPGVKFVEMEDADRCAGGAGTYLVKDWALSQEIFNRKQKAITDSGAEVVATSCPACMIQLQNGLKGAIPVKHVAQLVDEALNSTSK